ncbi:MAG TPA: GDP-mannose 4,6-dehydratase [Pirellulales bacterium]|nr:GDP-mannose 4,6-dehydratase [Pirellulales bacterium]
MKPTRRALVIGSNCFTGSHMVDALLARGDTSVVGVSRSPEYDELFLSYKKRSTANFQFMELDYVANFDDCQRLLDEFRPQVVINVAAFSEVALSIQRPVEYFETNALAVVKLVNALKDCEWCERYVHISSAEIYGNCPNRIDETQPFNPSTPYAASKAAADLFLSSVADKYPLPITVVRSTNVYGAHQQLFKIIPRTAIYLKQGKAIELHGGGTSVKSFIHIRDVVDGTMLAIDKKASGVFHFSTDNEWSIGKIVRHICQKMGYDEKKFVQVVGERPGQDARYWLDCTKANQQLGWKPKVDFDQGVAETIRWVEDNWTEIQRHPLVYVHKTGARAAAPKPHQARSHVRA